MTNRVFTIATVMVPAVAAIPAPTAGADTNDRPGFWIDLGKESGDITPWVNPEPEWPEEIRKREYTVVARPSFPVTFPTYMPLLKELGQPLRLTLAPGETGSAVIFVRSLSRKDMTLQLAVDETLRSKDGPFFGNYLSGARSHYVRRAEQIKINSVFPGRPRYIRTPMYLLHTNRLSLKPYEAGQFWWTVEVPENTPPGEYTNFLLVKPVAGGNPEHQKPVRVNIVLTVRNLKLLESDAAFGVWFYFAERSNPPEMTLTQGPSNVIPGSEDIYLADQRRHGMTTVAYYTQCEGTDRGGGVAVTFTEMDAAIEGIKRAGLCRTAPLVLLFRTFNRESGYMEFGNLRGGARTIMKVQQHAKEADWPEILFTVFDEPGDDEKKTQIANRILQEYVEPRKKGVRTVVAYPNLKVHGHLYDVWIVRRQIGKDEWKNVHDLAKKHGAEVWMYDWNMGGRNPLLERFYAGLWTWRTGVKGNMVWCYGHYARISDRGLPQSKLAWEARLEGVNDYRYLHTLEKAIRSAETAGNGDAAVKNARAFLKELEEKISLDAYGNLNNLESYLQKFFWNPVPTIAAEEYDSIRNDCAGHIEAIQALLKR